MKLFAKSEDGILGNESLGDFEVFVMVALAGIPFSEAFKGITVTSADCSNDDIRFDIFESFFKFIGVIIPDTSGVNNSCPFSPTM